MSDRVELASDVRDVVGESLVWDAARAQLVWIDIVGKRIHRLDPGTGKASIDATPGFVTSIGLRKDGGYVLGLIKDVVLWDGADGFDPFVRIEPDLPDNRLNEGAVGPDGAFWVGTMQNNIAPDASPRDVDASTGRLWRITTDGKATRICEDVFGITNTMIWTDDGRFVTADTLADAIYSYARAPGGTLSDRRTILANFGRGLPDGSCQDAEGFIWNCRVAGGGCLVRLAPDGRVDRVVDLPCTSPTSCAFGGEYLDRLYVTSARFAMSTTHLEANPQEGSLFVCDIGVKGRLPWRMA